MPNLLPIGTEYDETYLGLRLRVVGHHKDQFGQLVNHVVKVGELPRTGRVTKRLLGGLAIVTRLRIRSRGFGVIYAALVAASLEFINESTVVTHMGWIEPDSFRHVHDCPAIIALDCIDAASELIRISAFRVETNCFRAVRNCLVVVTLA